MLSLSKHLRAALGLPIAIAAILLAGCSGGWAQAASNPAGFVAMAKLRFMAGNWTCAIRGPKGSMGTDHVAYRFTANGTWMEETSGLKQGGKDYSSIQMWGFDAAANKLVAYQFTQQGVATKSVDGWQNGDFVSHRDDNGATVSVHQKSARAFDWIIVSKDQTYTVREECTR